MTEQSRSVSEKDPHEPAPVAGAFRVALKINSRQKRMDVHLLEALRGQEDWEALKRISRTQFKKLFDEKKILIKGQPAKPNSALNSGTTYVDLIVTDADLAKLPSNDDPKGDSGDEE